MPYLNAVPIIYMLQLNYEEAKEQKLKAFMNSHVESFSFLLDGAEIGVGMIEGRVPPRSNSEKFSYDSKRR